MKTFNKRGDSGETSLFLGPRVSKSDAHCEAYGTIDEAVSAMGLARSLSAKPQVRSMLLAAQNDLFVLAAELATPPQAHEQLARKYPVITESDVQRLEGLIEDMEKTVRMPKSFVVPGDSPASAAIHVARSMVRRAERRVVGLKHDGQVPNPEVLKYLNRLADLLFTLSLYEDTGPAE
jgi:ATP:cob(I)alamin adenosyltransferase